MCAEFCSGNTRCLTFTFLPHLVRDAGVEGNCYLHAYFDHEEWGVDGEWSGKLTTIPTTWKATSTSTSTSTTKTSTSTSTTVAPPPTTTMINPMPTAEHPDWNVFFRFQDWSWPPPFEPPLPCGWGVFWQPGGDFDPCLIPELQDKEDDCDQFYDFPSGVPKIFLEFNPWGFTDCLYGRPPTPTDVAAVTTDELEDLGII
ncbi:hypothetical protein B0T16DRAFT_417127 [Cercophora newfieldiana]|uniref:Uncharacterized protein n=1 Tax=Cercophora newfieldiana TaxID=92897 RepID=A0AA40CMQ3_9PEZI|nr:hypothetical protein B0T16DRAFT_417127 [Cercophora newfieldiana]